MKTLHSWTQPIAQLRRTSKHLRNWLSFRMYDSSSANGEETIHRVIPKQLASVPDKRNPANRRLRHHKISPPVMWVMTVVSFTSVMGNRYYNQPKLDVGKAAPQTIRAPFDATVEDAKTTEEKRKAARTGSVPSRNKSHRSYSKLWTMQKPCDR